MAFENGSATSLADFLGKLMTFATANGWTQDELDTGNGDFALSKNSIFVSGRWDVAGPSSVSLHQALAFVSTATQPGDHTDDSGNGFNSTATHADTSLRTERCINTLGDGPYPNYWFFENDANPAYLHAVVEKSTGVYRHFGFGELGDKRGNWTGGEYLYGHFQTTNIPTSVNNTVLLDGLFNGTTVTDDRKAATIHVEGLPGQLAGSKWAQVWGGSNSATPPDDSSAVLKVNVAGGYRAGPLASHFGKVAGAGATSGLISGYPIPLFFRNNVGGGTGIYLIGFQPDVRGVNMDNFAEAQSLTVGSDTWIVFPQAQKTTAAVTDRTYNAGIMYKRVNA